MANTGYVSPGKPRVAGAVYRAPLGTALPTSVDADLTGFESVGFISDAGVVNSNSMSTESIKAWGGYVVDETETEKPDTWKFAMLETVLDQAAKSVYGDDNVTGDLSTGMMIRANNSEQEDHAWVIDTIIKKKYLKRIVIPRAKVTAIEDITYADNTPLEYGVTLSAKPDESIENDTHREYIKEKASA